MRIESGKLVTFEGIEGCGKTLQWNLAGEFLKTLGVPFLATREPGGTDVGNQIRAILLKSGGPAPIPVVELLLYLADRCQHLAEVIEPALGRGLVVLSDRYHDATLAYQGYARKLGLDWIEGLSGTLGIRRPDVTLFVDVPVELGLKRARRRNVVDSSGEGRFEAETMDFHRRVREGYRLLAGREPDRIQVVDGTGTPDEVFSRIRAVLERSLGI
jgi:dTMP kinase